MKEVFYPLTTAEVVSAVYETNEMHVSVPISQETLDCRVLYTDAAFWHLFRFRFISGTAFGTSDVISGLGNIVISENVAQRFYGSAAEAVGKRIDLDYIEYKVAGVVKDVHQFAEHAYADVWVPYTVEEQYRNPSSAGNSEGRGGIASCYILAPSARDFDKICDEIAGNLARYNASSEKINLEIKGPQAFIDQMNNYAHNAKEVTLMPYIIMILVLLIVPSLNLSSMAHSRMKKRISEIGVRKAFGATRLEIIKTVLEENLFISIIGGVLGLVVSYLAIYLLSDWLLYSSLGGTVSLSLAMFSPWIFMVAFLFCVIINLLSAGIPAWKASGICIILALNQQ